MKAQNLKIGDYIREVGTSSACKITRVADNHIVYTKGTCSYDYLSRNFVYVGPDGWEQILC